MTLLFGLWSVTAASAYFAIAAEPGLATASFAWLVVAALVPANLWIARAALSVVASMRASILVAVAYTAAVFGAWYAGGQGSVEVMVVTIALLDLAIVGLTLPELAAIGLAMLGIYAVIG